MQYTQKPTTHIISGIFKIVANNVSDVSIEQLVYRSLTTFNYSSLTTFCSLETVSTVNNYGYHYKIFVLDHMLCWLSIYYVVFFVDTAV